MIKIDKIYMRRKKIANESNRRSLNLEAAIFPDLDQNFFCLKKIFVHKCTLNSDSLGRKSFDLVEE